GALLVSRHGVHAGDPQRARAPSRPSLLLLTPAVQDVHAALIESKWTSLLAAQTAAQKEMQLGVSVCGLSSPPSPPPSCHPRTPSRARSRPDSVPSRRRRGPRPRPPLTRSRA